MDWTWILPIIVGLFPTVLLIKLDWKIKANVVAYILLYLCVLIPCTIMFTLELFTL